MKYLMFFVFFFCSIKMCSQTEINTPNTSKVYFIRTTGFIGSLVGMKTFIDSEFKCNLTNDMFKIYDVPIGKHTFSAQLKGETLKSETEQFELNIEPNHVYYIQIVLETGMWVNKIYCEETTENTALKKLHRLVEDKKCN